MTSTETNITISWSQPTFLNGCPLAGYDVYRDNADNTIPSILVGNFAPQISSTTVVFTSADTSNLYRFTVEAFNIDGSIMSGIA